MVSFLGVLTAASLAFADGNQSSEAQAERFSQNVAGSQRPSVAAPIANSKAALNRASRLKAAGKTESAAAAEAAAAEWQAVADALLKAAEIEAAATAAERALKKAREDLSRAKALLEETEARKGRASAQLAAAKQAETPPSSPAQEEK